MQQGGALQRLAGEPGTVQVGVPGLDRDRLLPAAPRGCNGFVNGHAGVALAEPAGAFDAEPDALAFAAARPAVGLVCTRFEVGILDPVHRAGEQFGKGGRIGGVGAGRQDLVGRDVAAQRGGDGGTRLRALAGVGYIQVVGHYASRVGRAGEEQAVAQPAGLDGLSVEGQTELGRDDPARGAREIGHGEQVGGRRVTQVHDADRQAVTPEALGGAAMGAERRGDASQPVRSAAQGCGPRRVRAAFSQRKAFGRAGACGGGGCRTVVLKGEGVVPSGAAAVEHGAGGHARRALRDGEGDLRLCPAKGAVAGFHDTVEKLRILFVAHVHIPAGGTGDVFAAHADPDRTARAGNDGEVGARESEPGGDGTGGDLGLETART